MLFFSLVFQFIVQLHLAEDCMKRYNQTALKDLCAVEQVSVSFDNVNLYLFENFAVWKQDHRAIFIIYVT